MSTENQKIDIILDCDPGYDDAAAILLAAGNPNVNILAITVVAGNQSIAKVTRNALAIAQVAGLHDVPIAAGATRPLMIEPEVAAEIHGETGLDDATLPEEIDFTWQYYTLQKIRFDDRIELTTAIDPALRNWRIPSMSLQTLVENAVKHNSITGGNPLHIRIRTEGESILIENNYTPRSDGDKESLGMGLERIRSVYRFYTEENISISVGDGTFRCRLPLLPPEK